jgi:GDP-L-fucose synthase
MEPNSKIFIAGIRGMVGSAIQRTLVNLGYTNLVGAGSEELDLRNQQAVDSFFKKERPEYVFLAAARVGGIMANNQFKAQFLYDNLMIEANIIHAAYTCGVKKLLFLGSSCIYPKHAPQPIQEEYLLTGLLEPTNEPYAIAKIAGIKLCEAYRAQYGCNFISVMPTNLYGLNDNFDWQTSHVLPALLSKIHHAKINQDEVVEIWGTGEPLREFLHADDLANACFFLMQHYNQPDIINVGSGEEISIAALAQLIKSIVGYQGNFYFNTSMPDGTPRKFLDSSKIRSMGWQPAIGLADGIRNLYHQQVHLP